MTNIVRYIVVGVIALLFPCLSVSQNSILGLTYNNIPPPDQDSVLYYGVVTGACSNASAITTNNTAIQTALDSGRSNIYFPPGNYPHKSLGFGIRTPGQHVHGSSACTSLGTNSPSCPASIQDCSLQSDWPTDCQTDPPYGPNCGYLSVFVSNVEIDNLWIHGNNPWGSGINGTLHKGVFARGILNCPTCSPGAYSNIDNLYVHDMYVSAANGESIYSDANGVNAKFVHNTIIDGQYSALNTNNYNMLNVQITDNYVYRTGICMEVAAYDAYVLRNNCQGAGAVSGADAAGIFTTSYHVVAYNTINQWPASCCAVSPMHIGFLDQIFGGGVVAYNTVTSNPFAAAAGAGAAFQIQRVHGPEVIAFNTITFNGSSGNAAPGIMFIDNGYNTTDPIATDAILISNNTLNGNSSFQPIGIQIYSNIPTPNRIQINTSNTFGTTPTHTQYMVAPGGAAMSVFTDVINRALPYIPDGLPITP